MGNMPAEIDLDDARRRQQEAAEEAKRLEERGEGFASHAAWERYELITSAIAAHRRTERAREIIAGRGVASDAS